MTDLSPLIALIPKLEAATGGDWQLSADVCLAAGYCERIKGLTGAFYDPDPLPVTESLDAAYALIERAWFPLANKPSWGVNTSIPGDPVGGYIAHVGDDEATHPTIEGSYGASDTAGGATPALALCLALCRALAQSEKDGGSQ